MAGTHQTATQSATAAHPPSPTATTSLGTQLKETSPLWGYVPLHSTISASHTLPWTLEEVHIPSQPQFLHYRQVSTFVVSLNDRCS